MVNRSARCSPCRTSVPAAVSRVRRDVSGRICRTSVPADINLSNSFLNSAIQISLLPWLLLLDGVPLSRASGRYAADAQLSSASGRFCLFSSSILIGDIDSYLRCCRR